jgi:hypothetical protein
MPRPSPLTYLPLFTRALAAEIGIRFTIAGVDRKYFTNTLYECRTQANDPRLMDLIIWQPAAPADGEIFITKREVELED